jgi:hypothetical protein
MAQLMGGGFNAALVKPEQGSSALPLGKYPVVITASDVKPTKGGDGFYVEVSLEIIEGEHKGQSGAMRFNLYNNNDTTRKIAEAQLSAVCHVIGQLDPFEDTNALHGRPFVVEVGNQKLSQDQERDKSEGKPVTPYTEVKKVFDMAGNLPGQSGSGQPQQQQQQQQAPANKAWGGGNAQQQQQAPQQQQQQQQQWGGQPQQQQQTTQQPAQNGNGTQWGTNNNQGAAKPAWGQK